MSGIIPSCLSEIRQRYSHHCSNECPKAALCVLTVMHTFLYRQEGPKPTPPKGKRFRLSWPQDDGPQTRSWQLITAFTNGALAWHDGKPMSENPYTSWRFYDQWNQGWRMASIGKIEFKEVSGGPDKSRRGNHQRSAEANGQGGAQETPGGG